MKQVSAPGRWIAAGMAFDRATAAQFGLDRESVRAKSIDGHMHVIETNISKSNVCEYLGKEIPDFEAMNLEPNKKYRLYRDPKELAKAVDTFNRLPVLSTHVPVSSREHPAELVVGATGSDARFEAPYVKVSMVVWPQEMIDRIEGELQKELSSGYRYRADMTPGTASGEKYDGVMRDIIGNHVAVVKEGRAGPDVVVGDSKEENDFMTTLSRKGAQTLGALVGYLRPKLAADAKIDWGPIVGGVTVTNFTARRPKIIDALKKATVGKLAKDAKIDDVEAILVALDAFPPPGEKNKDDDKDDDDKAKDSEEEKDLPEPGGGKGKGHDRAARDARRARDAAVKEFMKDKMSEDDFTKACDMMTEDEWDDEDDDKKPAKDAEKDDDGKAEDPEDTNRGDRRARDRRSAKDRQPAVSKSAMDHAINVAVTSVRENSKATRAAERYVIPWVGALDGDFDSPADVYRAALKIKGVDTKGLHPDALKPILEAQPRAGGGARQADHSSAVGMDAAAAKSLSDMIPGLDAIRVEH